jgi:hypothetical protein
LLAIKSTIKIRYLQNVAEYLGGIVRNNSIVLRSNVPQSSSSSLVEYVVGHFPIESTGILTGIEHTREICRKRGLFKMSADVVVSFINFFEVPKEAFFGIHHRQTLRAYEVAAQFILEPLFVKHVVITALGIFSMRKGSGLLRQLKRNAILWFLKHIYNDSNIDDMASDDKYFHIFKSLVPNGAVSVFPDREGSQFYGDEVFYFRDGLFAASLAAQRPILDHVIVEPTPSASYTTIDIMQYDPPQLNVPEIKSASEYAVWRQLNQDIIAKYTRDCEEKFRLQLKKIEREKASNDIQGMCNLEDYIGIEKRISRNSYYVEKTINSS